MEVMLVALTALSELEVPYIMVTSIFVSGLSAYASCAVLLGMFNNQYLYNDEMTFAGQPAGDTLYASTSNPSHVDNLNDFCSLITVSHSLPVLKPLQ